MRKGTVRFIYLQATIILDVFEINTCPSATVLAKASLRSHINKLSQEGVNRENVTHNNDDEIRNFLFPGCFRMHVPCLFNSQ